MRKYLKNKKQIIHSTQLYNYLICPQMKLLSEQHSINVNDNMWKGLMLEAYLGGFKENNQEELELFGTSLTKSGEVPVPRQRVLDEIKAEAELIRNHFSGEWFKVIEHETENYILTTEIDNFKESEMIDLKRSTHKTYDNYVLQVETGAWWKMIQAFYYPYVYYLNTGKIIPFTYKVFDYGTKLLKNYRVVDPSKRFEDVKELIDKITNDFLFEPDYTNMSCADTGYGTCNFLNQCESGKQYLTEDTIVKI